MTEKTFPFDCSEWRSKKTDQELINELEALIGQSGNTLLAQTIQKFRDLAKKLKESEENINPKTE